MEKENVAKIKFKRNAIINNSPCGGVYGLGFIGAVIYFISNASTFWMGVWGICKAIVWPAYLVYKLFEFLGL